MEAKDEYKKGLWTKEEDRILLEYVRAHGRGHWNRIPRITELKRSGKSCRLRWMNYLSPNVKRGNFSDQEEDLIIRLHNLLGNRWSLIAGRVPGRTDNQVKNYWNSHLCKKLGIKKQTPAASSGVLKSETKTTHHHHQHHNSSSQMDSNPKHSDQSCCSSTSASATVKAMEPISVHVGDDSYIDQDIQWMTKHCADDSLSWSTHHPILSSWGMMQILDAYPPDLL